MYIIRRMKPEFPEFKPITLDDRDVIHRMLWQYQPDTSELTFTNLFIWRAHYGFLWSVYRDWLLVVGGNSENGVQALPPIGPSSRVEVTAMLLQWLKEKRDIPRPHIDRADRKLVSELQASPHFLCEPVQGPFRLRLQDDGLDRIGRQGLSPAAKPYELPAPDLQDDLRAHERITRRLLPQAGTELVRGAPMRGRSELCQRRGSNPGSARELPRPRARWRGHPHQRQGRGLHAG